MLGLPEPTSVFHGLNLLPQLHIPTYAAPGQVFLPVYSPTDPFTWPVLSSPVPQSQPVLPLVPSPMKLFNNTPYLPTSNSSHPDPQPLEPCNDSIKADALLLEGLRTGQYPEATSDASNRITTEESSSSGPSKGKLFKCLVPGCQREYRFKGDLKVHIQKKHKEEASLLSTLISPPRSSKEGKLFPCPVPACPCGYHAIRDLHRHMAHKHANLRLPPPPPGQTWNKEVVAEAIARVEQEGMSAHLLPDPATECWHRAILPIGIEDGSKECDFTIIADATMVVRKSGSKDSKDKSRSFGSEDNYESENNCDSKDPSDSEDTASSRTKSRSPS